MSPTQKAEIVLRCNTIEQAQVVVDAMAKQCNGKPSVPTYEFLVAICAMRPDAFVLEVKD